jgi:hypothetical protein
VQEPLGFRLEEEGLGQGGLVLNWNPGERGWGWGDVGGGGRLAHGKLREAAGMPACAGY